VTLPSRAAAAAAATNTAANSPAANAADSQQPPPPTPHPLSLYLPLLFPVLLMLLSTLSSLVVSRQAPDPYMDEIFHAPQTRRLCAAWQPLRPAQGVQGANWDPKITTFPGLYFLGGGYAWLQAAMLRLAAGKGGGARAAAAATIALCGDVAALRGLNSLLLALCLFPAFTVRLRVLQMRKKRTRRRRRRRRATGGPEEEEEEEEEEKDHQNGRGGEEEEEEQDEQQQLQQQDALGTALAAAVLLPTHFFYGFLYYTDVGALLFLLLSAMSVQEWAEAQEVEEKQQDRRAPHSASTTTTALLSLAAALTGGAAVAMRQTNAVWHAFLVGAALLRVSYARLARERKEEQATNRSLPPPLRAAAALLRHARASGSAVFAAQIALLLSPSLLFAAFVLFVNEGRVALGDHEAHDATATRHWAHPFYAAVFVAFVAGAPFFLRREAVARLLGRFFSASSVVASPAPPAASAAFWGSGGGAGDDDQEDGDDDQGDGDGGGGGGVGRRRDDGGGGRDNAAAAAAARPHLRLRPVALAVAQVAAAVAAARYGTVEHPYLLADNRHYTFYAWRRVMARHWAVRYAFAPVGAAAWLLLASELAAGVVGGGGVGGGEGDEGEEEGEEEEEGWLWVLGFALACAATLVPAGLIEPRYYTVPAVLAMLHAPARLRTSTRGRRQCRVGGGGGGEEEASTALAASAAFDWSALVACLAFSAVNAATLYVFAYRPFEWPDGSTARFMW
jgi:alpha-1,2-glucosyltransferase